jgi:hypothetical protein
MSVQGSLASDLNTVEKNVERGISKEVWQILEEKWGNLAGALHRLNIFLNFHGQYEHLDVAPDDIDWGKIQGASSVNNKNIELAEIRYGRIEGTAASKDYLWFILKHHQDSKGPISDCSLFSSSVHILSVNGNIKHKILPDVPVNVIKVTQHGLDTYVLLAMHAEPNEWSSVFNICKGRLEVKESAIVCFKDSQPQGGNHRSATWKAEEKN